MAAPHREPARRPAASIASPIRQTTSSCGSENVMRKPYRVAARSLAVIAATLAGIWGASADSYPSRPITVIVPFGAGGPSDVVARTVTEAMRRTLGQPALVENVTGASGTLGVTRAVRAAPDGYTISFGN